MVVRRIAWIAAIIAVIVASAFGVQRVIAWSDDTVEPPSIEMLASNQYRAGVIGDYCWKTASERPGLFGPSSVCMDSTGLGPMPDEPVTVTAAARLVFDLSDVLDLERVAVSFVPIDQAIRSTTGTPESNPDPPPGFIQSRAHQINRVSVDVSPSGRAVLHLPDTLEPGTYITILTIQPTPETYLYQAYRIDLVS